MAVQSTSRGLEPSTDDPYAAHAPEDKYRDDPGYGWVTFAGVLLLLIGTISLMFGIAAVGNSHFIASHPHYILGNQHDWGRVSEILGLLTLAAGCGVWVKNQPSRWAGVGFLALSAVAQLLMIQSYPFWSLSILTLCILAMYGLIAHGQKLATGKA